VGRIVRVALADQVADALLARIRSEEWPLGSRLPGENTLAPQLGVGRSTVREAIRQLAGRGVLTTRQGAGVFVTAIDVTEDWDTVLTRAAIGEVLEARIAIETEAASLAAERRTPADLRGIRRALAGREGHVRLDDHVDADMRFHRAVTDASHNSLLVEMVDSFVPRVRQAMIDMLRIEPVDATADQAAHAELVEVIADRDPVRAGRLSRAHLDSLRERLCGGR